VTPNGHWTARLWGKNLTDKAYVVDSFIFGGRQAWIGDPRVFGGSISYEF
jgi:outer membrane receptor protein involved in Fe transport